jgi:hypothetical protein
MRSWDQLTDLHIHPTVFLHLNPVEKKSVKAIAATFDFTGLLLIIGGVAFLLVGFDQAGLSRWSDAETIAFLTVGGVMLIAGSINEAYTKKSPIVPPRLFKTRTTAGILILTFFHCEYNFPRFCDMET